MENPIITLYVDPLLFIFVNVEGAKDILHACIIVGLSLEVND